MVSGLRVGFLGAGRMASALARGWLAANLVGPGDVLASDPSPAAREAFARAGDGAALATVEDNRQVVHFGKVLVLAVKPQTMPQLLAEIGPLVTDDHLVVSIAAGIPISQLAAGLGETRRIVRVMPNTPCLIGASASAFAPGPRATADDIALVDRLFSAVGRAYRLPEHQLDAVTGLSGSGPAFVYLMIEALSDGGVRVGLPRDVATALAAQTVLGSARMVLETGQHPGVLKDAVTSPAGTTIAGLHALERAGARGAFIDAVEAATRRARELAAGRE